MKKFSTRLFCLFLSIVMLVSLFPAYAVEPVRDELPSGSQEEIVDIPAKDDADDIDDVQDPDPIPTEEIEPTDTPKPTDAPDADASPDPTEAVSPAPLPTESSEPETPMEPDAIPTAAPTPEASEEPVELLPKELTAEAGIQLLSAQPQADVELTIEGYVRVTEEPDDGLATGKYLIVAPYNGYYYMLYPGATGNTNTTPNTARLEVGADGAASGYRPGYGTAYESGTLRSDFIAAENQIVKTGGTHTIASNQYDGGQKWNDYTVTATGPDGSAYYLFGNANGMRAYQTTAGTTLIKAASTSDGYFRLRNTASNNSHLAFYVPNMNYNQSGGLTNNTSDCIVDLMLFKSDTVMPGANLTNMLSGDKIGGGNATNADPDGQNSWVFTGGRAAQGSYTDIKGARTYAGHFEEYIRYTYAKLLQPSGESTTPYFQRHVINTAYEGQTLGQIVASFDTRIAPLKPRAVSYLVDEGGSTESGFASNLNTLITNALALRDNTGMIVIGVLSSTDKAAVDAVVNARTNTEKPNILVVEYTGISKTGGFPNANGHLEMARQLADAVAGQSVSSDAKWPYGVAALPNSVMASGFPNKTTVDAHHTYETPDTLNSAQRAVQSKANNKGTPLTWLFMGDSITHGSAWTGGYDTLAQLFEKFVKDDLGRKEDIVINAGSSGATTTSTLDDLNRRLVKYDPDVVVLMLGTNDCRVPVADETYKSNLRTLLDKITGKGAIPVLRTPPPTSNESYNISHYADLIREVAGEDKYKDSVILVDQYARWTSLGNWTAVFTRDTLHPDEAGHLWFLHQLIKQLALWDDSYALCQLEYVAMEEPVPLELPGYTQVTGISEIDPKKAYLIVSQAANGDLFAFYPSSEPADPGALRDPGNSATNAGNPAIGARTAKLSVGGSTTTAVWFKDNSAVSMTDLLFTIEESSSDAGKYVFTAVNGRHLNMTDSELFSDDTVPLTFEARTGVTYPNSFIIKNVTANRGLTFNHTGDATAFTGSGKAWGTDFWCPRPGDCKAPIYLFVSNATAKDQLPALIARAEALSQSGYTAGSWLNLQNALTEAKAVVADSTIDGDADRCINARNELLQAIESLAPAPVVPTVPAGATKKEVAQLIPASGTTQGQPFAAGTGGSQNFRIPAMITLQNQTDESKNGRLVAAIDARWNHAGDACALDTILSYSDDDGANWHYSFPNYFGDSTDAKDTRNETAFIDPQLVEGLDGAIYMMADIYPGGVAINTAPMRPAAATGYMEIEGKQRLVLYTTPDTAAQRNDNWSYYVSDFENGYAPIMEPISGAAAHFSGFYLDDHYYLYHTSASFAAKTPSNDKVWCQRLGDSSTYVQQNVFFYNASLHVRNASYLWITKSTDGGETWSAPVMANSMVRTGNDIFYGVGPGAGLCMDNGTIVMPTYTHSTERAGFIYSTDNGVTWHRGNDATTDHSSESCLVQVGENTIRHFYRDNGYSTVRYTDHTWNGSSWTTGAPVTTTAAKKTGCQLSAIKYSQKIDGKDAIILSTPAASGSRSKGMLYVFLVNDNPGHTMTLAYSYGVNGNAYYAYSSLSETKDGDIALIYENAAASARFEIIPIGYIIRTISATGYEGVYDGKPHSITVSASKGATLQYSTDNGSTWQNSNPTFTDAGEYTVKVKGTWNVATEEVTAKVKIGQVKTAIHLRANSGVLSQGGSVTLTVTGVPDAGTVTLSCSNHGSVPLEKQADGSYVAKDHVAQAAGEHTFTATYTGDANHTNSNDTYTITVLNVDFNISAKGFLGSYDGKPHSISVIADPGVTVTYSDDENGSFTSQNPSYINAGTYTVWFKAVSEGGQEVKNSAQVVIEKVTPSITLSADPGETITTDQFPLRLTISGVPEGSQGKFTLTSAGQAVRNLTENGNGIWIAAPALPRETRAYTFEAVFDPTQTSAGVAIGSPNYERVVRTIVISVTQPGAEEDIFNYSFVDGVQINADDHTLGTIKVIYDGLYHGPSAALTYDSGIALTYAERDGEGNDPVWNATEPTYQQPGQYRVACMAHLPNGSAHILTVILNIVDEPTDVDLAITPNFPAFNGGGKLELTVTGAPQAGELVITCDKGLKVTETVRGKYTVNLPNKTEDYTFTATYAGAGSYHPATASCSVSVAAKAGGGGGGVTIIGGGGGSASGTPNPDGSVTTTAKDPVTGATTITTQMPNGAVETIVTGKDGSIVTTHTALNGVVVKTTALPDKEVTAQITVPDSVRDAKLSVPSARLDYSTVAIDRNGELILLSVPNEAVDQMLLRLGNSQEITLTRRPNGFVDVTDHWAKDAIDFTTAHRLFQGVSDVDFAPQTAMSRGMLVTVLARLDGVDTSGGETWYEKGANWAKELEISDIYNLEQDVTREQLATMLWRYAGCPTATGRLDGFADGGSVSPFARTAMRWAVQQGIFDGTDQGLLAPLDSASRAQVSTVMLRFCRYLVR